jgi:D-alanyl-D-alanine carboxypeptidase
MKNIIWVVVITTLLFSCGSDNNNKNYSNNIDELLDSFYQNDKFMGNVSLSHEGLIIYSRAVGFAELVDKKASTERTKYRVGSISKMFTAVLVFKAIEEGELSIDTPLSQYYPEVDQSEKITIGYLLNHRSGIPSFTKDKAFFDYRTEYKSHEDMLAIITSYSSHFEPGTENEYSNSNYFLLSQILEKVYELSYNELLQSKVIQPLSLEDTYLGSSINVDNNEALSYTFNDQWTQFQETELSIAIGSGSLVSSSKDLNRFIYALFNEEIISKDSLKQMTLLSDNMGMGIMPFAHKAAKGFGHGGHIDAFHAITVYLPEEKLAVSITSNAIDYNINNLLNLILTAYFGESFELPNFDNVDITPKELEKYIGVYKGDGPGVFTITQESNILFAQLNDSPKEPLVYKGDHVFMNEEIGASFVFNPTESTLGLEQSGVADTYMFTKQ